LSIDIDLVLSYKRLTIRNNPNMKTSSHRRILVSFAFLSLISASALAADDSFTGKWKLNPDKSQFTG
jgi:hypothetical protein